jgi:hypothetical protein
MKLAALALVATLGLGGAAHADPGAPRPDRAERARLRQMMLAQFDANHDGQLDPQERHRAVRALRHLARRLAREGRPDGGRHRRADRAPGPAAQPRDDGERDDGER